MSMFHPWETPLPMPSEPLRVALIGAGNRPRVTYLPVLPHMAPWINVVAVCDPNRANAESLAACYDARPYDDIRQLVTDRPIEAAIVVTQSWFHCPISVYLSSHGIHNLTETPWATMVAQAQLMADTARRHNVIARVGENFFRTPIDRFASVVRDAGYLGRIGRIFSYADHTGYHNNSRWIAFAGCHPDWVQSIEHDMDHAPFYYTPGKPRTRESLSARYYHFPTDFLVADTGSSHVKGTLGRHARPGYTEWQGEQGTLVYRATTPYWADAEAELRKVSADNLAPAQETTGQFNEGGIVDQVTPVELTTNGAEWSRMHADTPDGPLTYANPFSAYLKDEPMAHTIITQARKERTAIMDHLVDFTLAVRGMRTSEFTMEDALMSVMMETAAKESALQEGRRIRLPLTGETETDARECDTQRQVLGVDPLDIEAMLLFSTPRGVKT